MMGAAGTVVAEVGAGQVSLRVLLAFGLAYAIGFERAVRGSIAGDRTFSLIGIGSAVIGFLASRGAPNALAGVVTGIGFIGAGVILHRSMGKESMIEGVTTAATIFAAAGIGAAAGQGEMLLAAVSTVLVLLALELRHLPLVSALDGRRWAHRFIEDSAPPRQMMMGRAQPPESLPEP